MENTQAKEILRAQIRQKRAELSDRERHLMSRKIAEHFISTVPLLKDDVVAGFWPMLMEVDIRLILEMLEEQGFKLALPAVEARDKPLLFRAYKRGDNLRRNSAFPVEEPLESCEELVPNVVLVPLMAFDKTGARVGFGGGFYDRTLAKLHVNGDVNKRLLTVGIAYSFQQVSHVPVQVHDERLDCVVTEKGVILFDE